MGIELGHILLELASAEATVGRAELERPEEVGHLLEVGSHGVDLVDDVFHADDAVLPEALLNDGVVGERDALGEAALSEADLAVSTLVDQLADALQVRVAVGDEGLDNAQHLGGSLGQLDEDTRVDLQQTKELEGLALLRVDLVDTLDTGDKDKLGLGGYEEVALLAGLTTEANLLALSIAILLDVRLRALEDDLTLLLVVLRHHVRLCIWTSEASKDS